MPSPFAELERIVSDAIDGHYGESTRVVPMGKGRYFAGSADAVRPPLTLTGIVDIDPTVVVVQDKSKFDGMRPAVTGDKVHVSYDEAKFTTWRPQAGDEIVLLDRCEDRVRITRVDGDGLGRIVCVCARKGEGES